MKTVGLLVIAVFFVVVTESRMARSYYYRPAGRLSRMIAPRRLVRNSYRRRQAPIEFPAMSIKRKYLYTPAGSISALRSVRKIPQRYNPHPLSQCPSMTTHNRDILAVITEALNKINENRPEKLALKRVLGGSVQLCKKCTGGRCVFDHNKATATLSIAPVCKSTRCRCGVEIYGKEATCSIKGWTKPHRPAYNVEVDCGRHGVFKPQNPPVEVPAGRIKPKETTTMPVTTTTPTTEGTSTTSLPIVTLSQSDELDIVTDDIGSGSVTLFNNENDETRPAPLLDESKDIISDEELLQ